MKWFADHWALLGGVLSFAILAYLFLFGIFKDQMQTMHWIHFVTLLLHQLEEYIYPGGFKDFFNKNIAGQIRIIRHPLNDVSIVFINVLIGWSAYFLSALFGHQVLWLTYGLLGVTLLNGILHTIMFVVKKKYNPGLVTGFFLQIPFSIFFVSILIRNDSVEFLGMGIAIFIIAVLIIPFSIFIAHAVRNKDQMSQH